MNGKMLILGIFFIAVGELFAEDYPEESLNYSAALAVSGCCKVRDDTYRDNWRVYGYDFDECDEKNEREDNDDNLFRPDGYVWWDAAC